MFIMVKSKNIVLGIAIALISVFFFAYAVQAIYPAPEFGDYCDERFYDAGIDSKVVCEEIGGRWTDYDNVGAINGEVRVPKVVVGGWCDVDFGCREDYNNARESYERNVFFANLIIGVVVLIGAFFLAVEAVSTGLMGGAVMLIVYATIRYWGNLSDVWRTVVLGLSLALLIGLAYKKLK